MFETKRFHLLFEAVTPVCHSQGTFGNKSVFMRRKAIVYENGVAYPVAVPVITGNAMRHNLREATSMFFLAVAGLLSEGQLTRAACRLLFNGGMLKRGSATSINLEKYREMVDLCPPLGILGGCVNNRIVAGRSQVEDAMLVCKEHQRYLPEWVVESSPLAALPHTDLIEKTQNVRFDPILNPAKRLMLSAGERTEAETELSEYETDSLDDSLSRRGKSAMMPYTQQTVVRGAQFCWTVTATCHDELDYDTLKVMLAAFCSMPQVGGKSGTGHGRLKLLDVHEAKLPSWSQRAEALQLTTPGEKSTALTVEHATVPTEGVSAAEFGERFVQHVTSRKEQVQQWFQSVSA